MSPLKLAISVFGTICVLKGTSAGYIANTKQTILMDQVVNERLVFNTTIISSFEDCVEECKAVTSCRLVNYRRHGHICELVHYLGHGNNTQIVHSGKKAAGFVSWTKTLNQNVTSAGVCSVTNCQERSCKVDSESDNCKIYACRNPEYYNKLRLLGNMYAVNSKLVYCCLDHVSSRLNFHQIKCGTEGFWTKLENGIWSKMSNDDWTGLYGQCGYSLYSENDLSFAYKIVNVKESKSRAELKCNVEGARLVSFLTWEKEQFFQTIRTQMNGPFWIDAEKSGNSHEWYTSDGQVIQTDTGLWYTDQADQYNKLCARVFVHDLRIRYTKCDKDFFYICEI